MKIENNKVYYLCADEKKSDKAKCTQITKMK